MNRKRKISATKATNRKSIRNSFVRLSMRSRQLIINLADVQHTCIPIANSNSSMFSAMIRIRIRIRIRIGAFY